MKKGSAMPSTEKIVHELETLPAALKEEALDFIGYLKMTEAKGSAEIGEWNRFSLESALRGLEDDDFPAYQESDLKEVWK